ncbi:diguanylate cyclase [Kineosporia rhizophila]|uniref:sensor domain-containing diguanylate cyclase n=1 Tax=Kineosporia rhizophila TaxID=84633 RepID=UPI001E3E8DFE|nr:diguanylate cyclase [Kineosporia rhizophila]
MDELVGQPGSRGSQIEAAHREQTRVEAVHALGLLEAPVSDGIGKVVSLAAELCDSPNATINIVDEEWLHSIASVGEPMGRFPREDIPCDLVVRSGEELVVEDASQVPDLARSPMMDGTLGRIGFYASVPLRTVTGHVVGTLCAWDEQPHPVGDGQVKMLRILADHAIGIVQMGDALDRARHATERLAQQSMHANEILETTPDPFYSCDEQGRITYWNSAAEQTFGWPRDEAVGADLVELLVPPPDRAMITSRLSQGPADDAAGLAKVERGSLVCKDGTQKLVDYQIWASRHVPGRHVFARDVTRHETAEKARRSAEELFAAAFHHASDGIAVLAVSGPEAGRIVRVNPAAKTLTGRSELVGLTLADVLGGPGATPQSTPNRRQLTDAPAHPGDPAQQARHQSLIQDIALLVSEPAGTFANDTLEHTTRMPVGTGHIFIHLVVTLTRDDQDRPEHILVQMRDVTARQAHEQWRVRQTQTDSLTGLGNRLAMKEQLTEEIGALRAPGSGLGVLMIDLDNFRAVNERLGRPAGDDLLCRMATALVGAVPLDAYAARVGGDEFVVLAPSPSLEAVQELAGQVSGALTETASYFGDRLQVEVGASIGLAFTQSPDSDPEDLLMRADQAMYENKRMRRFAGPRDKGEPAPLYAVPAPRDTEPIVYPPPTPAPRHIP